MLKLHPSQLSQLYLIPPTHTNSSYHTAAQQEPAVAKDPSVYRRPPVQEDVTFDLDLPSLDDPSVPSFELLRESVLCDGLLSFYVCLSISSIGSE